LAEDLASSIPKSERPTSIHPVNLFLFMPLREEVFELSRLAAESFLTGLTGLTRFFLFFIS
jgi:hypothetical protein